MSNLGAPGLPVSLTNKRIMPLVNVLPISCVFFTERALPLEGAVGLDWVATLKSGEGRLENPVPSCRRHCHQISFGE